MHMSTDHFEGPEKKLEIILRSPQTDLRKNADQRWHRVISSCNATIISKISTKYLDAWLLSESSLFVWDDCILMITCGKTALANALNEIMEFVDRDKVAFIFYERRNFMFPDEQPSDFETEVEGIHQLFPGKSYRMGPATHDHLHLFYYNATNKPEPDVTLQVLMTHLSSKVTDLFSTGHARHAKTITEISGLDRLYPGAVSDEFLFSPQGYSLNGIVKDKYYTIHVTPQASGSYVSFETNIISRDYSEIIRDVVSIFDPGSFSLAFTTSMDAQYHSLHKRMAATLPGYRVTEKSLYEFDCGYAVTFSNYTNQPGGIQ